MRVQLQYLILLSTHLDSDNGLPFNLYGIEMIFNVIEN